MLRENLIRLAGVDVSASATGPSDHDLTAPPRAVFFSSIREKPRFGLYKYKGRIPVGVHEHVTDAPPPSFPGRA